MGQNHSDMLCADIFSGYIKYVHYKERPKCLLINKQINKIYTKTFFKNDKQTVIYLNEILRNDLFFKILLEGNYQNYIRIQDDSKVRLLYEFAFYTREVITINNHKIFVVPLHCITRGYATCRRDILSIVELPDTFNIKHISLKDYFCNYGFYNFYSTFIFLDTNKDVHPGINGRLSYHIINSNPLQYLTDSVPQNFKYYSVESYWVNLEGYEQDIVNDTKQQFWNIIGNMIKEQNMLETLQMLKDYDSFVY
jgi:hypothetical protein